MCKCTGIIYVSVHVAMCAFDYLQISILACSYWTPFRFNEKSWVEAVQ